VYPSDCKRSTTSFFSSGDIRAKTCVFTSICKKKDTRHQLASTKGRYGTHPLHSLKRRVCQHPTENITRHDDGIILVHNFICRRSMVRRWR
jgi:hypothetical protein